ncbi:MULTISPECIES: tetratricopeptide repeat protein [unclassified Pedobacter]|uniref:tetratricopeptide repeat protein n=1 Tax=unclassified Pedobacter TaxID=2628915 RepID=UPI00141DD101|nr:MULTISPECIES: tetratricopeptide repeat protein [unclassified Pedobacter]NII84828.1 tetratricopeptide (TPR) repeat protein [Pedobacter sp. SG908]NMN38264.1 tetratricopeptide (TPR) repeat protein [Pedobacter sp. SG918]
MKISKKAITLNVGLVLMGSAVFAQSLTDAKKAIDAEQYQKASSMLKSLVSAKASDGENYYNLGLVYLKTGYIDSARAVFTKGVTADPKNNLNLIGLGEADMLSNNPSSAKTNFDKAVALAPKDYKTYLYIGKAYLAQDKPSDDVSKPDFTSALANITKADELDSKDKDAEVFLAQGDAYALQKKNSEALGPYMRVGDVDPNNRRAKTQIGKMYKESRAFPEGEKELQDVIAADANYGPAYRELGELYLQWSSFGTDKEKAKKAIENYKKYMDLTDKSLESQLRYAQFLFYAKDFPALEQVASAIQAPANDPKNAIVSRMKGWAAYENKNYPAALTSMNDFFAKEKDPNKILGFDYLYLGKAQLKAGQDSLALINITKAVEKDSTNADALAEVAKSFYDAKKYTKSAEIYEKAIKANPKGKGALYNYYYNAMANYFDYAAKLTAKQNPSKDILVRADSSIAKVTQLAPETYDAYLTRARINSLLDDEKEPKGLMLPFYEEYIKKITEKPELATANAKKLSEAYDTIGGFYYYKDKEKAKEYFNKSVAVYPSGTFAAAKLKELAAPAPKGKGK